MSPSGTVGADERLRLFLGFRLPDATARAVAAWQQELAAERVRIVSVENLHVTIAFLGSQPAGEIEAITGALRESVRGIARPVLTPMRYRETRSVGMLVLDDEEGSATRIAEDAHARLERLGVYEQEAQEMASAPHRRPLSRAPSARALDPGSGAGDDVRRCCLHVSTAA